MARETKRLNMNMPVDTLESVDAYAEKMCITRTSAILVLCNMALDSQMAMNDLNEFLKVAKEVGLPTS